MQEVLQEMRAEVNNMDWSVDGQAFVTLFSIYLYNTCLIVTNRYHTHLYVNIFMNKLGSN